VERAGFSRISSRCGLLNFHGNAATFECFSRSNARVIRTCARIPLVRSVPRETLFFAGSPSPEIDVSRETSISISNFSEVQMSTRRLLCNCRRVDIFARPVTRHSRRQTVRFPNHTVRSNAAAVLFPAHPESFECSVLLPNAVRARLGEAGWSLSPGLATHQPATQTCHSERL
jgi:hypothetical protein